MVFLVADVEPTIFLMLTEADCNDMRGGRTKFVDGSVTKGRRFEQVVLSLHKNQSAIEATIKQAGHGALLVGMPSPSPTPEQMKCAGCEAILQATLLLDDRCIACWRELARTTRAPQSSST